MQNYAVAVLYPVPAAYGVLLNYVVSKVPRTSRLLAAVYNFPWVSGREDVDRS
jgi:hypothetical protein